MNKVELLVKPASYLCNLDCTYCFYKKTAGIYKNPRLMKDDILEKFIASVMEYSAGGPCIFSWQGGEPLLAGIDFYKKVVELQSFYGKNGQIVSNTVQTNGILIDEQFMEFFGKYNVFVGLSLDGPADIHNFYRKYPSGRGTFKEVMAKARLMRKNKIEFNVLSTIGEETSEYPEKIYKFLVSEGFRYLQFIPAVDRKRGKVRNFSLKPETYGEFLCRLFDVWWNNGKPAASVRFFDNIMEILIGLEPGACSLKKRCGEYLVVEHNGDVYPCDFFVNPSFKIGNVADTPFSLLVEKASNSFGIYKKEASQDECSECRWQFICNNGCLWHRWVASGDIKNGAADYFCAAYKRFFAHSIEKLEVLAGKIAARNNIPLRY